MKVLVPVRADSPARTRSAVQAAISLFRENRGDVEVCLLSVQPLLSSHVAMYFPRGQLDRIQKQAGRDDLQVARGLLDDASVPYTTYVRIGRSAETIAAVAEELGCQRVLLGDEPGAGIVDAMFGSLASQVRKLLAQSAGCKVIAP